MKNTKEIQQLLVIDTHVHIHACFNLSTFLESAYKNCRTQARLHDSDDNFLGVLLMTESSSEHWFQHLQSLAKKSDTATTPSHNNWTFHLTDEEASLYTQAHNGSRLLVVAGRQVITKEKLEVLALITAEAFQEGETVDATIKQIQESGGIPVLPWGFGKWWGARGNIVTDLLNKPSMRQVFLGDNGGRPRILPYPRQFAQAKHIGLRILPGSDPLPFPSEMRKPCSVGVSMKGTINPRTPGADLKQLLQDPHTTIAPYFQHETVYRFFKNQLALRFPNNSP